MVNAVYVAPEPVEGVVTLTLTETEAVNLRTVFAGTAGVSKFASSLYDVLDNLDLVASPTVRAGVKNASSGPRLHIDDIVKDDYEW